MKALEIGNLLAPFFFPPSQTRIWGPIPTGWRFPVIKLWQQVASNLGIARGDPPRHPQHGSAEAVSSLILDGSDQKELASTRSEIVFLIEGDYQQFSADQSKRFCPAQ